MSKYYIYALIDPRNEVIRYVGITINPQTRLREHIGDMGVNDMKDKWIAELKHLDLKPSMKILEECKDSEYAAERELYWIQKFLEDGIPLTNIRVGRQGFTIPTAAGWATIKGAATILKSEGYKIYPEKIAKLANKGKIRTKSDPLYERARLVNLDELRTLFASRLQSQEKGPLDQEAQTLQDWQAAYNGGP